MFGILFCACNSSSTHQEISAYKWNLEFITDLDGKMLVSNVEENKSAGTELYQLTLIFEKDSFILTDETNQNEWTGTYSIEKVNDSYKVDMILDDSKTNVTGVYGTRVYSDDTTSPSITLQTEDKILSFIAE